jgi:aryl-alcohol dehydrogenase-like predicted oxidoreductase
MTFGSEWGWGADETEARRIFDFYIDAGGNFIDTANVYTNGTAERFIGKFAADKRDRLVISTKYSLTVGTRDPNSCGNHRKSMVHAVEASLGRLLTDYIDVLYLHAWDGTTPVEEILRAMDDLVRAGKVLYLGISDTPAWQISRMQSIADLRGWSPLIALQMQYNLIERTGERDLIPMAREIGLGIIPWAPLAGGVLTGKYTRADLGVIGGPADNSRRADVLSTGALSERGLAIADLVRDVAQETGHSASQVALAWVLCNPDVTSVTVGARTLKQLHDNIGSLDVRLPQALRLRLDSISAIDPGFPHNFIALLTSMGYLFGEAKLAHRGAVKRASE